MSQANTEKAKAFQERLDLLNRDFIHHQCNKSLLSTFGSSSIHSLCSKNSSDFATGRAMSPPPFHSMFAKDVGTQFIGKVEYDILEKPTDLIASVRGESQAILPMSSDDSIVCRRQVLYALDSLDVINHQKHMPRPTVSSFLPKGANVVNAQSNEPDIEGQVQQLENTRVSEYEMILTGKMRWVLFPLTLLLVIMCRYTSIV
ncbi:MAG: hypothetical protein Q9167_004257 [Letrouitia subvulpina]